MHECFAVQYHQYQNSAGGAVQVMEFLCTQPSDWRRLEHMCDSAPHKRWTFQCIKGHSAGQQVLHRWLEHVYVMVVVAEWCHMSNLRILHMDNPGKPVSRSTFIFPNCRVASFNSETERRPVRISIADTRYLSTTQRYSRSKRCLPQLFALCHSLGTCIVLAFLATYCGGRSMSSPLRKLFYQSPMVFCDFY